MIRSSESMPSLGTEGDLCGLASTRVRAFFLSLTNPDSSTRSTHTLDQISLLRKASYYQGIDLSIVMEQICMKDKRP